MVADLFGGQTTAPSDTTNMSVSSPASQLASSDSLQQLDERHEELLTKLDALYRELETALANLQPKHEGALREAA